MFASETRHASRELASAVRAEAGAWQKYVREGTFVLGGSIAPVELERKLLVRVAETLRAIDMRVRRRIDALAGHTRRPRGAKAKRANGANLSRREASASRPRARAS